MKNPILRKLILLMLVCIANRAFSQDDWSVASRSEYDYIPSMQTWSFIRYGNTPVDYYTGTARVDVPIYRYTDSDFDISISAGYASNGFQPLRQTGILGLNWFLNCGGAITREIRGYADDIFINDDSMDNCVIGFLRGSDKYDDSSALNDLNGQLVYGGYGYLIKDVMEMEADIFHFNFMGHSGTFHYNGQKQACVYNTGGNHGTYKIEYNMPANKPITSFTITTSDGYVYFFGDDNDNAPTGIEQIFGGNFVEYGNYKLLDSKDERRKITVTWLLKKITAPNGRTVTFDYDSYNEAEFNFINSHTSNPYYITSFVLDRNDCKTDMGEYKHYRKASVIKTSYLKKIKIGDTKKPANRVEVDFSYSIKNCKDAITTNDFIAKSDANIVQKLKQLDAITVRRGDAKNIRQCNFIYRIKDEKRLILDAIDVSGIGKYSMAYYEDYEYPEISTPDVDFWGYYNGNGNDYSNIIATKIKNDGKYEEKVSSNSRNPHWQFSILGCLKRIEYPTKGYTEFKYEANRAKCIILRNEYNLVDQEIKDTFIGDEELPDISPYDVYLEGLNNYSVAGFTTDETGGVRVSEITDYDGLGGYKARTFKYSDGIVSPFPRFWLHNDLGQSTYNKCIGMVPIETFDKSHIGYSSVNEIFSDGSRIEYRFNTYKSHPNEYDGQFEGRKKVIKGDDYIIKDSIFMNNIMRIPNSRHYQRGKLNRTTYYDKNNRKVKCEYYKYADHNADLTTNYSLFVRVSCKYAYPVRKYTGDYRLTEKSVTEYFGTDSITTRTTFEYNDLGQIRRTSEYKPDGNIVSDNIEYLHEFASLYPSDSYNRDTIYVLPYRKYHMVEDKNGNRCITSATEISYLRTGYINQNIVKPKLIKEAEIGNPVSWSRFSNIFPSLNYKTKISYEDYDSKGNPTQLVDEYGVRTSYVWGYDGLYPVVKAVNVTRDVLNTKLGITAHEPLQDGLSDSNESDDFPLFDIDGALINLYYYEPHVGMTKYCDPTRRWTYFSYDAFGRLIMKWDDVGAVETYEYHIE